MLNNARQVAKLEGLARMILDHPGVIKQFKDFGAVSCVLDNDPPQFRSMDGRWTFDPRNRNYEKAFWLSWPNLAGNRNAENLGNLMEAILGIREAAVQKRHFLQEDCRVLFVAELLSNFVNSVYQFTMHSKSEYMDMSEWLAYVQALSVSQ